MAAGLSSIAVTLNRLNHPISAAVFPPSLRLNGFIRRKILPVCFVIEEGKQSSPMDDKPESTTSSSEILTTTSRLPKKAERKKSERFTYLIAAVMSSFGITSIAIMAVYYRFSWQMKGGEVPLSEMFGTFALSVGAAVGMEFWARWAHRALWHASLWNMHESHHKPREGAFELNDVFAIINAVPAIGLLYYGFFNEGLVPGLCFGAAIGHVNAMVSSYESWGRKAEEKIGVLAQERDAFLVEARRQQSGWEAAKKETAELSEQLKAVIEQRDRLQAGLDEALAGRDEAAQKACEELKVAHFRLRDEFSCYLNVMKARRAAELMYNQVVGSLRCANLFLQQGEFTEDDLETIKADERKYREELGSAPVAILPESFRVPIFSPSNGDAVPADGTDGDRSPDNAGTEILVGEEGHKSGENAETGEASSQRSGSTSSFSSEG